MVEEKTINGDGEAAGHEIVKLDPKPYNGFSSKAINHLEKLMVKFMYDSTKPHHWLASNFSPVPDETPPNMHLPVHTSRWMFNLRRFNYWLLS